MMDASHPSHVTVRISVRRDHAIGKLNVERDLQKDVEHNWELSPLMGGSNLISHLKNLIIANKLSLLQTASNLIGK